MLQNYFMLALLLIFKCRFFSYFWMNIIFNCMCTVLGFVRHQHLKDVAFGKDFIWVGTLQTYMFKEYYWILLTMDTLFDSRHITNTNNGLTVWQPKWIPCVTLEVVQVYQASTFQRCSFWERFIWVGTLQTQMFKEYYCTINNG